MFRFASSRRAAAAACIALGGALLLSGCSNSADQQRIAQLEQEIDDLKQQNVQSQGTTTDNASSGSTTTGTDGTQSGGTQQGSGSNSSLRGSSALNDDVKATWPELADFESRVAAIEQDFAGVTRSSDINANYQTLLDKKGASDALDFEMESFEDAREREARAGAITYEQYLQVEHAISYLDDRLSIAEDQLELALGVDD